MFITEMNKQVKEENEKQQGDMDKYNVKDYMKNAGKAPKMTPPKMPSFKPPKI